MKIAFFWTWEFSKNIASSLFEKYSKNLEILLWVSQPDKPFWRKKILKPTQLKSFCEEKNIEILQPETLKNNIDFIDKLKSLNLDFIIVVAYGKIIPKEILEIPKYGCINIHGSILPAYRGASPIQESLKNGDTKTWLTIMYMSEGMDEGDILSIQEIDIEKYDTTQTLFQKFEEIWPELLVSTLKKILSKEITGVPQEHTKATYCQKISKQDGQIDFILDNLSTIWNKYRAYTPWPWIYTFYMGKKFDLIDIDIEESDMEFDDEFALWDVVEYEDHGQKNIALLVKWWLIILKKIKLEWKKEMSIFDFVNGNKDFLEYNFNV